MAEPLVISFAADTSRAQGAMATLTAQIVGNMTAIGVAMSGGAANSNTFGASLQGLASNAQRAAAAVGQDVRAIASATAGAATADRATLEGVVRAFTGAAVGSNTAGAAVRTGLSATTSTIAGVAAQVPSLNTLLAAFLSFEAAKLVFDSVAASIEAAHARVADFVRIGREAESAGVGSGFFQRATLEAEKFGLTVEQVTTALQHARAAGEVRIGEGRDGANGSANDARWNLRAPWTMAVIYRADPSPAQQAPLAAYDSAAVVTGFIQDGDALSLRHGSGNLVLPMPRGQAVFAMLSSDTAAIRARVNGVELGPAPTDNVQPVNAPRLGSLDNGATSNLKGPILDVWFFTDDLLGHDRPTAALLERYVTAPRVYALGFTSLRAR